MKNAHRGALINEDTLQSKWSQCKLHAAVWWFSFLLDYSRNEKWLSGFDTPFPNCWIMSHNVERASTMHQNNWASLKWKMWGWLTVFVSFTTGQSDFPFASWARWYYCCLPVKPFHCRFKHCVYFLCNQTNHDDVAVVYTANQNPGQCSPSFQSTKNFPFIENSHCCRLTNIDRLKIL